MFCIKQIDCGSGSVYSVWSDDGVNKEKTRSFWVWWKLLFCSFSLIINQESPTVYIISVLVWLSDTADACNVRPCTDGRLHMLIASVTYFAIYSDCHIVNYNGAISVRDSCETAISQLNVSKSSCMSMQWCCRACSDSELVFSTSSAHSSTKWSNAL